MPNQYTNNPLSASDRFWSKVQKTDVCWMWQAGRSGNGYGAFSLTHSKQVGAHKFAWESVNGPVPEGMAVCHTCDVILCVRNDDSGVHVVDGIEYQRVGHLFLATNSVNSADMVAKGRQATGDRHGFVLHPDRVPRGERNAMHLHPEARLIGEKHWKARLTWADVDAIRSRYADGITTIDEIHTDYPIVGRAQINQIIRGEAWIRLGEQPINLGRGRQRDASGRMKRG